MTVIGCLIHEGDSGLFGRLSLLRTMAPVHLYDLWIFLILLICSFTRLDRAYICTKFANRVTGDLETIDKRNVVKTDDGVEIPAIYANC